MYGWEDKKKKVMYGWKDWKKVDDIKFYLIQLTVKIFII